jgi:glucan phosphoethanolaminetransferase (alkaline phosphatase superfamily)
MSSPYTKFSFKNSGWLWQAILWLILISPLALGFMLSQGRDQIDALLLYNLCTTILWSLTLYFAMRRVAYAHLLMLPLYILAISELFTLTEFGNRFTAGYIEIVLTDFKESGEFFAVFGTKVLLLTSTVLIVFFMCVWRLNGFVKIRQPLLSGICFLGVLACYGAVFARGISIGTPTSTALTEMASKDLNSPLGPAVQAALAVHNVRQSSELRRKRQASMHNAVSTRKAQGEIYVWVIGESSRPQSWSLFGYGVNTNPLLKQTQSLILLPDLITTAPHTSVAVPSMLSLKPVSDWNGVLSTSSVISAFNELGSKSFWLSTQENDGWGGSIPAIAQEAKSRRFFDKAYDGALLPELNKAIEASASADRTLIVLHTKGSHWQYSNGYPGSFEKFGSSQLSQKELIVAQYDNSVLYTDWLLHQIITRLALAKAPSMMIYTSDHGENLLDDGRKLLGHALGNEFDLQTTGLVWVSDEMHLAARPALQLAEKNAQSPLSLSNVSHSLLNIAGISAKDLDLTKSIFSERFRIQPRPYIVRGTAFKDYVNPSASDAK